MLDLDRSSMHRPQKKTTASLRTLLEDQVLARGTLQRGLYVLEDDLVGQ